MKFLLLSASPSWVNMEKMEPRSSRRCIEEEGEAVENGESQLNVRGKNIVYCEND